MEEIDDALRVLVVTDDPDDEDDDEEEEKEPSLWFMGFLYCKSPRARDMLRDPTRAVPVRWLISPPASSIRDFSRGMSGLWGSVRLLFTCLVFFFFFCLKIEQNRQRETGTYDGI